MVLFTLRSQSFYYRSKAGRNMFGMDDIHWIFPWCSVCPLIILNRLW